MICVHRSSCSWRHFFLLFLLASGILGCVATAAISYHIARKFVGRYQPTPSQQAIIQDRREWLEQQGAQLVHFLTADDLLLEGLLMCRPHARYTIIACHGYHRTKEDCWRIAKIFNDATILFFDFRAHGQSQGDIVSIGWHERNDVQAAVKFVRNCAECTTSPIVGIGFSMGAAALIGAAAQGVHFDAIIADSSFDNLAEQIGRVFTLLTGLPHFPFFWLSKKMFSYSVGTSMEKIDVVAWAKEVKIPTLVIHSSHDDFTPSICSQKLYATLAGPKKIWLSEDASHACAIKEHPEDYKKQVENFLETLSL